jgi:hypothetical protein
MKNKLGYFILGSAIIWAAIILGCAFALKGMPEKNNVIQILSGGFIAHLLFIWGPMAGVLKKMKDK